MDSAIESLHIADTHMAGYNTATADTAVSDNQLTIQEQLSAPKPKGFMRLPAEIRNQIYEDYFIPSLGLITKCHPPVTCHLLPEDVATDLANTALETGISTRRSYGCQCPHCEFSSALLLTNHQIHSEARPILESTFQFTLNVKLGYWQFTWANFSLDQSGLAVLKGNDTKSVPPFVKIFVVHLDVFEPEDILELDSMGKVAEDLAFLHSLADQVEFIVEVHIALAFEDRALGWSEPVSEKSEGSEQFVADQEAKAQDLKVELMEGLTEEFEQKGKKFRMFGEEYFA